MNTAFRAVVTVFFLLATLRVAPAQSDLRAAAEVAYSRASDEMRASPEKVESLWKFARATFDLAEYATNATERAALARKGIDAARTAIKYAPNSAAARYYLGMNIGQLARTRYLSALKLVDEMEAEFIRARELDPKFDYAGPDRNLGLLYRDAPVIGSVGSRRKAQHHLNEAVKLAPIYPENRLNLIESLLKWGDSNGALREFKALQEGWEESVKALAEASWAPSWADWKGRRDRVAERLKQSLPGIKSPRAQ